MKKGDFKKLTFAGLFFGFFLSIWADYTASQYPFNDHSNPAGSWVGYGLGA